MRFIREMIARKAAGEDQSQTAHAEAEAAKTMLDASRMLPQYDKPVDAAPNSVSRPRSMPLPDEHTALDDNYDEDAELEALDAALPAFDETEPEEDLFADIPEDDPEDGELPTLSAEEVERAMKLRKKIWHSLPEDNMDFLSRRSEEDSMVTRPIRRVSEAIDLESQESESQDSDSTPGHVVHDSREIERELEQGAAENEDLVAAADEEVGAEAAAGDDTPEDVAESATWAAEDVSEEAVEAAEEREYSDAELFADDVHGDEDGDAEREYTDAELFADDDDGADEADAEREYSDAELFADDDDAEAEDVDAGDVTAEEEEALAAEAAGDVADDLADGESGGSADDDEARLAEDEADEPVAAAEEADEPVAAADDAEADDEGDDVEERLWPAEPAAEAASETDEREAAEAEVEVQAEAEAEAEPAEVAAEAEETPVAAAPAEDTAPDEAPEAAAAAPAEPQAPAEEAAPAEPRAPADDAPNGFAGGEVNIQALMARAALEAAAKPQQPRAAEPVAEPVAEDDSAALEPQDAAPAAAGNGGRRGGRVKTRLLGFQADAPEDVFGEVAARAEGSSQAEMKFPVGWMVVVAGPGRGSAFSLHNGVSLIGRGDDQTIRLNFGDTSISRNNHASVAFDDESGAFYLGHGGKSNIVRLNGKPVLSTEELSHGDKIRIGETTLRFAALCGADFNWSDDAGNGVNDAATA